MFVPLDAPVELMSLKLTNNTDEVKHISIFSFLEWCLWNASTDMENFQRNFSTGEVEVEGSTIYHKTEYKERRNHYAFFHVNSDIVGFDTDRESFLGLYNGFDEPQVVSEGKSHDSVAHGWSPVASHHVRVTLEPGESRSLEFMLGYVELPDEDKWESKGIVNKKRRGNSCHNSHHQNKLIGNLTICVIIGVLFSPILIWKEDL